MDNHVFTVTEVNNLVKLLLDNEPMLQNVCVRGELSNYKMYPSGHHYFTLKDPEGAIRCVMFKGSAMKLRFRPENGMKVLVTGRISVFPRDGAYQLYCTSLTPDGVGDLYVAFEQLKAKLAAEGLFDPAHKKPLPKFPHRIAIITSGAGAAVMDMLRILGKRYPLSKVMILPVRVQGVEAPAEIASAVRYANRHQIADIIITGRGGGSIEDLWAFNDERVARAVYASEIPVISAVGHEPDVTICDFVADVRAATPSNGAELAAPDQTQLRNQLQNAQSRLLEAMTKQLKLSRQTLDALAAKRVLQSPENYLQDKRMQLDYLHQQLIAASQRQVAEKKQRFIRLTASLEAMSPLKVLSRGYSVVRAEDGTLVTDASRMRTGDRIRVQMQKGSLTACVEQAEEETI